MRRRFRLWIATWRKRLALWYDGRILAFDQRLCPHRWRPARINGATGKICGICSITLELPLEDFYAEFGESGFCAIPMPVRGSMK